MTRNEILKTAKQNYCSSCGTALRSFQFGRNEGQSRILLKISETKFFQIWRNLKYVFCFPNLENKAHEKSKCPL